MRRVLSVAAALGLDEAWTLDSRVALRPEAFGALAYHFGNRRLTFLRRPELVSVVRGLADAVDVRTCLADAGVPEQHWPAYAAALGGLAESGMLHRRESESS